jgi:hypothetical protein
MSDELLYWFFFFALNVLLFLPNYLLYAGKMPLLPLQQLLFGPQRGIFMSLNQDPFRISVDFFLLFISLRFSPSYWAIAVAVYYLFQLIFHTYHAIFFKLYQVFPVLHNDIRLMKNGAGILWAEAPIRLAAYLLAGLSLLLGIGWGVHRVFSWVTEMNAMVPFSWAVAAVILIYLFLGIVRKGVYDYKLDPEYRFIFTFLRFWYNVTLGRKLQQKLGKIKSEVLNHSRNIQRLQLASRPNIYLLFIESYGGILLDHPLLSAGYLKLFSQFKHKLGEKDWHTTLARSLAPTHYGPSWLSYSSVLLGHEIKHNYYYEGLVNQKVWYPYDTLSKVLQKAGYHSINLNATRFKKGVRVPLPQLKALYGIDQFILRNEIHYEGPQFGFTESPPDQYVLEYAYHQYLKKMDQPFVLFYLTKNSHSPFKSPRQVLENYRDWEDQPYQWIGHKFLEKPNLKDFYQAIEYQLDFLSHYILTYGGKDDLFLLMGDHQPHDLADAYDTSTLVHIVSQNDQLLQEFRSVGFREDFENMFRHEALYSIFVNSLIKTYGSAEKIPNYESEGLRF